MRRNRTGLMALASAIFVLGYVAGKSFSSSDCIEETAYFDTQRGHLRRLDGASIEGRVVFLGGSSFQGLDTSAVTPAGLNLSIGGDTLQGLIERSASYRSLTTARAVIINIGLNDLMRDCAQPLARIEDLFVRVPAETPIILLAVQGVQVTDHSRRCDKELSRIIDEFNSKSLTACGGRRKCQFLPNPVTTNMDQRTMKNLQEPDGIHLSVRGYLALSNALRNELSKLSAGLVTTGE